MTLWLAAIVVGGLAILGLSVVVVGLLMAFCHLDVEPPSIERYR